MPTLSPAIAFATVLAAVLATRVFVALLVNTRLPGRRPGRTYLTVLLVTVISLVLASVVAGVLADARLVAADRAILEGLDALRAPAMVMAFAWLTDAGSNLTLAVASVMMATWFAVERHRHLLVGLVVVLMSSQLTLWLAKFGFHRPRPEFTLEILAHSPSFPSGHSLGAITVYGYAGYAVARRLRNGRWRFEACFWTAVLVSLVAFSRILLHVHHPSDVLAGLLLGGLWLVIGVAASERRHDHCARAASQREPGP